MDNKRTQDSSMLGRIIGYNNRSGLLYTTMCGLNQCRPKTNLVPKPPDYITYQNINNTENTLESMNAEKPPNYYTGNKKRLVVPAELQPPPFSFGGKPQ